MGQQISKFVALFDAHVGWERVGRIKRPVHDERSLDAALEFISDFKPDAVILGGDQLDLACISHWNDSRHLSVEDLSVREDVTWLRNNLLKPLRGIPHKVWHDGNHERFALDLIEKKPALRDILDIPWLCNLQEEGWKHYGCGEVSRLGSKLYFCHGENIRSSKNVGRTAVEMYQRNIRFGHHHRMDVGTLVSPIDVEDRKTGISVPCLCHRGPKYGNNSPNAWTNGFLYGYMRPNGDFHDYVVTIVNGSFITNGKVYGAKKVRIAA